MLQSFNYIVNKNSKIIILGSMPGVRSLQESEYYAHPRNAFWKILQKLFDGDISSYENKKDILYKNNIALWDVLKNCKRSGSLDTSIQKDTIVPNDFKSFFKKHPNITKVFCNGTTAYNEFMKVYKDLDEEFSYISVYKLPSTSPANAKMRFEDKLKSWSMIKE